MEPYASGKLPSQDGHEVAWYAFGNPEGAPVLFLHGGPGSGFSTSYLDFYPLERVRLITFDQRGTGKSTPFGGLENNTTQNMLEDIERLRTLMGVDKWDVTGHSWGSTLAVFYAKNYPQHCKSVKIVSFFGATAEDQEWSFEGIRLFFPADQAALQSLKAENDKRSLTQFLFDSLNGPDAEIRLETAYRLSVLSSISCRMNPKPVSKADITGISITKWKLLFFYATQQFFLKQPHELYTGLDVLKNIPCTLLHGRFDMDCPPAEALRLQAALPSLEIIWAAGNHSSSEEPMLSAFKQLMQQL